MSTFTDKELIKEIKERIGSLDVRDNIERRAYEIALASLEAEPVSQTYKLNKLQGNSPVTPDGWISCSELMPDKLIPVMVMYEDGEMWSAMWNGNRWDDGTEYPDPHSVTHWREMPAAPQQEVK